MLPLAAIYIALKSMQRIIKLYIVFLILQLARTRSLTRSLVTYLCKRIFKLATILRWDNWSGEPHKGIRSAGSERYDCGSIWRGAWGSADFNDAQHLLPLFYPQLNKTMLHLDTRWPMSKKNPGPRKIICAYRLELFKIPTTRFNISAPKTLCEVEIKK